MSTDFDAANDFLMNQGAKSFPFENIGDTVRGTIVSARLQQQTSLEGNQLLTWTDGSPRMQLVITLQTDLQASDTDDGQRTIYAKGGNFEASSGTGQAMRNAIAEAVRTAKAEKMETGDELAVSFTGLGQGKRGQNPPKLYTAGFRKATSSVAAADLFDN